MPLIKLYMHSALSLFMLTVVASETMHCKNDNQPAQVTYDSTYENSKIVFNLDRTGKYLTAKRRMNRFAGYPLLPRIDTSLLQSYWHNNTDSIYSVEVPTAQQYDCYLPDSTHALLNAETTLRVSTCFDSSYRKAYLDGEAAFEVRRRSLPFEVVLGSGCAVRTIDADFSITSYTEDPYARIVCQKGSLEISTVGGSYKIAPGTTVLVSRKTNRLLQSKRDTAYYMNWVGKGLGATGYDIMALLRRAHRWGNIPFMFKDPNNFVRYESQIMTWDLPADFRPGELAAFLQSNGFPCSLAYDILACE